ncbi:MAG: ATP-binding protein [Bacteroidales bacterium]|nr:ATP-binding protein [Bacteroidales bacterium]
MKVNIKNLDPKGHYRIEQVLSVILLLVFVLVTVTSILSFIRLNNIILSVKKGVRPEQNLILAKEIFFYLSEAENSVKSYSLTKNNKDMVRFYELTDVTGNSMDELKGLSEGDDSFAPLIDSLELLVSSKFDILDQLLVLQDEYLVNQAMHEVMRNIRQQEKTQELPEKVLVADTLEEPPPVRKDNFFSRLFRKKDKEPKVVQDTTMIEKDQSGVTRFTVEEISREVKKVQQKALQDERARKEKELELLHQDRLVMNQIRAVMAKLELMEDDKLEAHILSAEKEAAKVKSIFKTYGLAALLSLILVAIVIFIYIKKNNQYRKVLRQAKANAEELARRKESFLANMSHEIKTPMNIISGYLNQVLQGKVDNTQRDLLEIVKKSTDHLLQLLNNLLDLSKIQSGKLEMLESEFNPREIIADMEQWFTPGAKEKQLELITYADSELPQKVSGDPVRLRQVLFNLVGNAIKFTEKGSVSIRMFPLKQEGSKITLMIEVADTGIGISMEDQKRIFEEFEQAISTPPRIPEGTGLGLSITRHLVDLLGGSLEVLSQPGEGSTFRVTIPYRLVKPNFYSPEMINHGKKDIQQGLRVLVVDDEAYNRKLVRMSLEKYGYNIIEAESGQQAIDIVSKEPIDIILMDLRMPGMKGSDAARLIRSMENREKKSIPIIAFSAGITHDEMEKCSKNGINDFIAKPFDEKYLLSIILRQVQGRQEYFPGEEQDEKDLANQTGKAGYDLSPLRVSAAGNNAFFREMVQMFVTNTASGLDLIAQHIHQGEWQPAADMAHKISAPCRHLRAEKLYSLLKAIQHELESEKTPVNVSSLIKQAKKEFGRIRDDIRSHPEFNVN